MKILMFLNAPYPDDVRVSKEIYSLKPFHEIYILCIKRKDELLYENKEGLHIYRINSGTSLFWLSVWDIFMSVSFIHPLFYSKAARIIKHQAIDYVHVHDLPLCGTGIRLAKRFKIKSIIDLHENYPEALKVWFKWKKNIISKIKNRFFMNEHVWTKHERYALKNCDHAIAVVDEMKERMMQEHGITPHKISVITNSEHKWFTTQEIYPDVYPQEQFIVAYTGNVGPHRGVDTLINSFQYLTLYPHIKLYISGSMSEDVRKHLMGMVEKSQLQNQVFIRGHQPYQKFYSLMKLAAVNVIPHHRNGHTDHTIPHKLYQAMLTGNPVVVSSSPPLKRVVEKNNAGLVFEAGNAQDLAEKLKMLYENKNLYTQLGSNGLEATLNGDENWETTSLNLLAIYD